MEQLDQRGLDYVSTKSDKLRHTPYLNLGTLVLRGYSDIMLYFLFRRPVSEKPQDTNSG
jgi:hypothetical protein